MNDTWLYITQILLVLASIYISIADSKKKIYVVNFLFNACCLIMYIIRADMGSGIVYAVITIRSLLYTLRREDTSSLIPISCTLLQFIIGCMSYTNVWSCISIIAPTISCLYLWYCKSLQNMRLWNVLNHSLWLAYNLQAGLFIAAISRVIIIFSNILAYVKERHK